MVDRRVVFCVFFGYTAGEVFWLNRNRAVAVGKAFAFSFTSNLLCIMIGFFVSMIIFRIILAMAGAVSLYSLLWT